MPIIRYVYARLTRRLDVLVRGKLWLQVLFGLASGALVGAMLGPDLNWIDRSNAELVGNWLALPGQIFLALIRMVIIPLAASSIILGIAGTGGGETLKRIGSRLAFFVMVTTLAAAAVGVAIAKAVRPGRGLAQTNTPLSATPDPTTFETAPEAGSRLEAMTRDLPDLITGLIPQNISQSLVEQDILAIVFFALFIGIAVVNADRRDLTRPIVALAEAVLEACMTVIRNAMRFAPVAVFGLIADTTASNGLQTLADLAVYCAVVLSGLLILLILYLGIVTLFGAMSPVAFIRAVGPVQLLAFSTSSSAAVMPLTVKTAVEKLGVSPAVAGAVVPLASTVNMAGTALYQAAAIVFLAQSAGTQIALGDLALMMVTLTGASIGAPAAPGASLAILAATASSFGVPLTGLPLIIGVDRILDMARTTVNVTGDLVACRILSGPHEMRPVAPTTAQLESAPIESAPVGNSETL